MVLLLMTTNLYAALKSINGTINRSAIKSSYGDYRKKAQSNLKKIITHYHQAISLNSQDKSRLTHYRDPQLFKTKCLRFFNIPPKSWVLTKKALKKTQIKIDSTLNRTIK